MLVLVATRFLNMPRLTHEPTMDLKYRSSKRNTVFAIAVLCDLDPDRGYVSCDLTWKSMTEPLFQTFDAVRRNQSIGISRNPPCHGIAFDPAHVGVSIVSQSALSQMRDQVRGRPSDHAISTRKFEARNCLKRVWNVFSWAWASSGGVCQITTMVGRLLYVQRDRIAGPIPRIIAKSHM